MSREQKRHSHKLQSHSRDGFPDLCTTDAGRRASRGQLSPSRSLFKWLPRLQTLWEMCKTCLPGIHCPAQLHLATSMHLGKGGGQERQWHYKTTSHFPYSLALCLLLPVSGKGIEGRSPMSFFSDLQCYCFSGPWPSGLSHDKPKHYWANSIQ